jgi:hypothetical protein
MKITRTHALTLFGGAAALSAHAFSQTPIVSDGDVIPGVGNVTRIDDVFVNSNGHWIVEAETDNSVTTMSNVVIANDVVIFQEGTTTGIPLALNATLSTMDVMFITDGGNSVFIPRLTPMAGGSNFGVVLWNGLPLMQEFVTPVTGVGAPAGALWEFIGEVWANDSNQMLVVGNTLGAIDVISLITHDGLGNVTSQQILAIEGVQLPGAHHNAAVQGVFMGRRMNQINQNGDLLWLIDDIHALPGGASNTCCDSFVYLNSSPVISESGVVPFDLATVWGTQSSTEVDLNDSGDWVINSARNPNEFNLDVIVKNGTQLIAAEGMTLPPIAPWLFTQLGPGAPTRIDNGGNVFYYADWDDTNLDVDTGIFRNQELFLQEGVSMINGTVIDVIASGAEGYEVSRSGQYLLVEVTLVGGADMAVLYDVNASVGTNYCGPAVVNSSGNSGVIHAQGSALVLDNDLTLLGEGLALNAFAYFLASRTQGFTANPGGSAGNICLGGAIGRSVGGVIVNSGATGTIAAIADLTVMPQPTGTVAVVAGETWHFQCWFRDSSGGVATSNFTDATSVLFN